MDLDPILAFYALPLVAIWRLYLYLRQGSVVRDIYLRAPLKNRRRVQAAASKKRIEILMRSTVERIGDDSVELLHGKKLIARKNDAVIVCAGGIPTIDLLHSMGIETEPKYQAA